MKLPILLNNFNINQTIISKKYNHIKDNLLNKYNLITEINFNDNILFFGMETKEDIDLLLKANGKKIIIFKNIDIDILLTNNKLKKLFDEIPDKIICNLSNNNKYMLSYYGYNSLDIEIDLINKDIFHKNYELGNCIFINNGFKKSKSYYYGKKLFDEFILRNPNYNYIFSNELDLDYKDIINIYKKCFIGIRNSNSNGLCLMENEMFCIGIPTINNSSKNGLKWDTIEDIENIVKKEYEKKQVEISIVMSYLNRKDLLLNTLNIFENTYQNYNFEVVIVDDNSNNDNKLNDIIKNYSFYINLIEISEEEKGNRINPCTAYNIGLKKANGKIIIIQNPECYHLGNIIDYVKNNLTLNNYISFPCYTINTENLQNKIFNNNLNYYSIKYKINEFLGHTNACDGLNENLENDDIEWLNSIYYKTFYHYCSAIYKETLKKIDYFDEKYSEGYCFDDDNLVLKIENNNLELIIPNCFNDVKLLSEVPFVIHQWHTKNNSFNIENIDDNNYIKQKWLKNKKLYDIQKINYDILKDDIDDKFKYLTKKLIENKIYKKKYLIDNNFNNIIKVLDDNLIKNNNYSNYNKIYCNYEKGYYNNIPKICFTYWDMSNLSFMHLLTLYTFKKNHPDFDIILYYPKKRVNINTWTSFENKEKYNNISYLDCLDLMNIKIVEIDFENELDDIPFYLSEVIKSDFFRLYICKTVGGIWFDMDTFWINNIKNTFYCNKYKYFDDLNILNNWYNKINTELKDFENNNNYDNSYFVMCHANQDGFENNYTHFCQYILMHNNKSEIVKLLYDECIKNLNIDNYESIGTPMFSKILSKYLIKSKEYNFSKSILNINIFARYKWFEMEKLFFENDNNYNLNESACIHWFNGSPYSKTFISNFNHTNFKESSDTNFKKIFNNNFNEEDFKFFESLKKEKKISIVMSYFNRKEQLRQTLESIKKSLYKNIEIIIIDDNSDEDERVNTFINEYTKFFEIKVITIENTEKTWINPCIGYNIGFKKATGDIIIIQNPEVMHVGDCISYIANNLKQNDWITFNCYGSPNFNYNKKLENKNKYELFDFINNSENRIGGNSVERNDVGGWVNHFEKHFVSYHYLAAINRNDLLFKMNGGFDEIFKDGVGADDDDFIKRLIYNKFNFKISKFEKDKPFCIHLYHNKPKQLIDIDWRINNKIMKNNCILMNFEPQNNIELAPLNETPKGNRIII